MSTPSISVVVPSFQQPQFLERCVASVLEQDHTDFEVLIVDDASRDGSLGLALALAADDERVRVVSRRRNGGLGRARNTGLVAARGEWVTFLDSDDYLLPGALSSRLEVLESETASRPEVVGAYGDWMHVGEADDHPRLRAPRKGLAVLDREAYRGDNQIICSSPLVRRSSLLAVGGFGEGLAMLEDFVAWARLLGAGGVLLPVEHLVCVYRQRPSSMLRGRGLVLPSSVRAINDWWAQDVGVPLGSTRRLRGWLEGADPRTFERAHWLQAAGEDFTAPKDGPSADPASTDAYREVRRELERTEKDLEGVLIDTVEAHRDQESARLRPATGTPDLVLVPTDLEGALECAACYPRLEARGIRVRIGLVWAKDLALLPPDLVASADVGLVQPALDVPHLVFSSHDSITKPLMTKIGRENVVMRATGTQTFGVYRRGVARQFRANGGLLLRSRLEMAELGDRPSQLLPSGARYALEAATPTGDPVVLMPASFAGFPALEGLVASVVAGLTAEGFEPVLLGGPEVARRLPGLRFADPRPELLTGTVVLPDSDEVALVRALGGRPVVLATGSLLDHSPRWSARHPLRQTVEDVVAAVEQASEADGLDPVTELVDPGLDVDGWVALLEQSLPIGDASADGQ